MSEKVKPMDFTPQQINLARELVKKIEAGDTKANKEFHERFTEPQIMDLLINHVQIQKMSRSEFKKILESVIREQEQKSS